MGRREEVWGQEECGGVRRSEEEPDQERSKPSYIHTQSAEQLTNRPTDQPTKQPTYPNQPTGGRPIANRLTNQPTSQPTNQPINQPAAALKPAVFP
eukprot:363477-Chlamydomonas_euryale.AAC.3